MSLQAAVILSRLVGPAGIVGILSQVIFLGDLQLVFSIAQLGSLCGNLVSVNVKLIGPEVRGRFLV